MTIAIASTHATAAGADRRLGAVHAARVHSRRVAVLRWVVPALAGLAVAAFALMIVTDPRNALSSSETAAALDVARGRITMEAPRLTGFNANGRTYEVTADRAEQSTREPGKVALSDLTARVQMHDEGWAHFAANTGRFDVESQVLDLDGDIRVTTNKGDAANLSRARIELKGDRVTSDQPVRIRLDTTHLSADSMMVSENGNHVIFEGRVVMRLQPHPPATEDRR